MSCRLGVNQCAVGRVSYLMNTRCMQEAMPVIDGIDTEGDGLDAAHQQLVSPLGGRVGPNAM